MEKVKDILDGIVESSGTRELSFTTTVRRVEFEDDLDDLLKTGLVKGTNEADPTADLALSGDIMNEVPRNINKQPFYEVDDVVAKISWTLTLDVREYGLYGFDIDITKVSLSATINVISMTTDETRESPVNVDSDRDNFGLYHEFEPGSMNNLNFQPKGIRISLSEKTIIVEF